MSEDVDDRTPNLAPDPGLDTAAGSGSDTVETPDTPDDSGPDDPRRDDPGPAGATVEIDIVGIEADLDGVQAALARLADGTYWTDEVTGEPIPGDVLDADPMARRA